MAEVKAPALQPDSVISSGLDPDSAKLITVAVCAGICT